MATLSANSKRAALQAIHRLCGAPEWADMIRLFRAEHGGDRNEDELVDFIFQELQKKYLDATDPIRQRED